MSQQSVKLRPRRWRATAGRAALDAHALLRKKGVEQERRQERSQITVREARGTITARSIVRAGSDNAA